MNKQTVTGIILAGGASRRMGKDKGLCIYNSKELVKYSIDILLPICDTILISTNNPEGYKKFGYQIIEDEFHGIGPIGGILSCLKQSKSIHNLIVSCDTPFLNSALLRHVLMVGQDWDIVVPQHANSYYEPLASYYSSNILPTLEESIKSNDYKLINLFSKVNFKAISVDELPGSSSQFKNLNSPEDLT
ncbi:MAG: molybdenum cofactor guanylyltransferase [Bacteroidetes bacterium]|nr:molybdenum cofactor guanylyltransferase [Bacteroidota bacterium]